MAPARPAARLLRRLARLVGDRHWHSTLLLRLRRPAALFQPIGETRADRYPGIFALARDTLGDGPDRSLLSFGCSTGEEVWSLRRYFPQAHITGIDINPYAIATCEADRRRNVDPAVVFVLAASAAGEPAARHDAVFAMAVFRHGRLSKGPPRCDPVLEFAAFERALDELVACLKPGGLLAVRHANFRVADTAVAASLDCLLTRPRHPATPRYGRDNRLIAADEDDEQVVFRKRAGTAPSAAPSYDFM
jgi:SAM-dependent methyltransferase